MNTATVRQVEEHEEIPAVCEVDDPRSYVITKRIIDVIVCAVALIALMPLFLAVTLAILIEDGAPVLYYQPRTGKYGKPFRFYKFRTMRRNADDIKRQLGGENEASGPIFKMKNDPRITKVGKILRRLSIDEAPQLINVLRGEMSIVGPRPLPIAEASGCTHKQWRRHSILPGLLCYREVMGRSALSFERWMDLDLDYVGKHNLIIDAKIMLKAVPAVLRGDGAY